MIRLPLHSNSRRRGGFSLLELIVYLGIISLMSVVLAGSFVNLTRGWAQSDSRSQVESNIRFAIDRISQDVAGAATLASPTLSAASSTLSLVSVGTTTPTVYTVSSGVLGRSVNGGVADPVTDGSVTVDPPTFVRVENYNSVLAATTTSVQITLTFHSSASGAETAYAGTIRTTVNMR